MTSQITIPNSLVSVDWLKSNLQAPNLIVLNATIPKVVGDLNSSVDYQIPNTRFFDIKKKFSVVGAKFPNTFPSLKQFNTEARILGINNNSAIVIYDEFGIYSSARAWWLFNAFGHNNVAVLDGGLPEWKRFGFTTELKSVATVNQGNFSGKNCKEAMCFFDDIVKASKQDSTVIFDARSKNRFLGKTPEPRKGLRSGTIPKSINLPFKDLLIDGKLKSKSELKAIFANLVRPEDQLYFSCGSGITACVLALAAYQVDYKNCCVYDGSWTEYGSLTSN